MHNTMAKNKIINLLLITFALLSIIPAGLATAMFMSNPFVIKGYVYCDTCRCGYETDAVYYIANATVRITCRDKNSNQLTYTQSTTTDSSGHYTFNVHSDRGDDFCDCVLDESPDMECDEPDKGRSRVRVILTNNNGMCVPVRHANAMGFLKKKPLANCPQILAKYQVNDS